MLPVLQIKYRAGGWAGVVPGRKIDDDIARRREVARSKTGMQTDPPLLFGSILGQRTSVSHYKPDLHAPVPNRWEGQGGQRQYIKWHSPSLHREMELLAFGYGGFPVVVFPTSGGRFFEYEDRGMVNRSEEHTSELQ